MTRLHHSHAVPLHGVFLINRGALASWRGQKETFQTQSFWKPALCLLEFLWTVFKSYLSLSFSWKLFASWMCPICAFPVSAEDGWWWHFSFYPLFSLSLCWNAPSHLNLRRFPKSVFAAYFSTLQERNSLASFANGMRLADKHPQCYAPCLRSRGSC